MKQRCHQCGELLPDDVRMCPFCEAEVESQGSEQRLDSKDDPEVREEDTIAIDEGTLIDGRYEVRERIGAGPKGTVFKAYDKALDRTVAFRVIPPSVLRTPEVLTRFKQELLQAQALTHKNVAQVLQHDTWAGNSYVVTEYVEGETLAKWLGRRGGSVVPSAALPIIKQIVSALDAAHSLQPPVIHCSINPVNIMVTPDGTVKVLDFGLSSLLLAPEVKLAIEGDANSLAYLAPEQVRGEKVGPWTDIYSLGSVLYYLLCGRPPFSGGDVRWKIMFEDPAVPEELPDYAGSILMKMLAKEVGKRPTSGQAVVSALEERSTLEVEDQPPRGQDEAAAPSGPSPQQSPKKGMGGLVGLAVAALIVVVAGYFFLKGGASERQSTPAVAAREEVRSQGQLVEEETAAPEQKVSVESLAKEPPLLLVKSTPEGADIFIDGESAGKAPRTFKELTEGQHEIRVSMDLYQAYVKKIKLNAGKRYTLAVKLEPLPFGDLEVNSHPAGAEVFLDGKKVGITPYTAQNVPKGKRNIILKMACFEPVEQVVEVVPLKKSTLDVAMRPSCGSIAITSNPKGAELVINGRSVGKTPYELKDAPAGELTVALRQECYQPLEAKIKVVPGEEKGYSFDLKRICSNLKVVSKPEGAKVFIDGEEVGKTPLSLAKLTKKRIAVELEKECYEPLSRTVSLVPGDENKLDVTLKRVCGGVVIKSRPSGATIFIDGKKVGKTPLDLPKLTNKKLRLKLEKACYHPLAKVVDIVPGKVRELDLNLKESCGAIKVDSRPKGAEVFINGELVGKTPLLKKGLEAGLAEVVVRRGMESWKKRIEVEPGKTKELTAKLEKKDFWVDPVTGMEFVWVPGGCFDMGCGPWQERCSEDEKPIHEVCLDGFWIGRYEVTQEQWKKIMGSNPSKFKRGKNYPVEQVSWEDVQVFIKQLEAAHGGKIHFSLPTEAQWEYACRSGGEKQLFCGGGDENTYAWYRKNSDGETHPVGRKRPNGLKLYDMSGNVQEWCQDDYIAGFYGSLPKKAKNPVAKGGNVGKVIRGGAYDRFPWKCRSSSRYFSAPGSRDHNTGFRLVRKNR